MRIEPNNPNILDTYGFLLLKNGRAVEARRILERVASIMPNNPSVNYHLALAYKQSGDRAQALSRVNKALESGRFAEEREARLLLAELSGTGKGR